MVPERRVARERVMFQGGEKRRKSVARRMAGKRWNPRSVVGVTKG